jgi:hypothetical protein
MMRLQNLLTLDNTPLHMILYAIYSNLDPLGFIKPYYLYLGHSLTNANQIVKPSGKNNEGQNEYCWPLSTLT